jgi:formylglycine-generating enzyme
MADAATPPQGSCCAPSGTAPSSSAARPTRSSSDTITGAVHTDTMVRLDGGTFMMGGQDPDGHPADGEGPIRPVTLDPFAIDAYTVTNAHFAAFVGDTGYLTTAEETGWSFVFGGLLPDDFPLTRGVAAAPWWRQVFGADWAHPEGPHSRVDDRPTHPVVHISWFDAVAYCRWAGVRLPTEAEWEYAARGGLEQQRFPWGDELVPGGRHRANVWQGDFPAENSCADGWYGTAPVDAYDPNGFGLFNVVGNVWEWTSDWFGVEHAPAPATNPAGPAQGTHRVMRGGSYLCHESYCNRYRLSARSAVTPDSTTGNLGFRCAR